MTSSFEEDFEKACADKVLAGAVCVASNASGSFSYAKAFGRRSLKEGKDEPLQLDSTMWIASCTKLVTSIAVLQCVERGQVTWDEDITRILPELNAIEIITGFDKISGKPTYEKRKKTITLRQLVTHSAGLAYHQMHPVLKRWKKASSTNVPDEGTVPECYSVPLIFQPGEAWSYSTGLDWAGLAVERLNSTTLEAYFSQHIYAPLGIKNMTFHPTKNPELMSRLTDMSTRPCDMHPQLNFPMPSDEPAEPATEYPHPMKPLADFGGQGIFTSAPEYLKILRSILANDGKLLQPTTVDSMFQPQLSPKASATLNYLWNIPELNAAASRYPLNTKLDWGLGGLMNMEDVAGGPKKNSLTWSGLPCLYWWIDRTTGVCGMFASQMVPTGDLKSVEWNKRFEDEIYRRLGAAKL